MGKLLGLSRKKRLDISRPLIGGLILLDILSTPVWRLEPILIIALESLAFLLILFATFGRLWALGYISGNKSHTLIVEGPYSLMRNPLYFFSLCGAIGLGLASKSVLVFSLLVLAFAAYYPLVIRAEEEHLERLQGDDFRRYKASVPAFYPRFSTFREQASYPVDARRMRRAFFSVMWFPLTFFIMTAIDRLQAWHILHPYFSIH